MLESPKSLMLLMEYLPYGSLHSSLIGSSFSALDVVEQCLKGLQYIHSKGVTHRDIKPGNIILQSIMPMHAKIIDFGLATTHPQAGLCGSLPYCAPEMWEGQEHSTAVDIWSFGMVILEIDGTRLKQLADKYISSAECALYREYFDTIRQLLPTGRTRFAYLLSRMLDENSGSRSTAERCLEMMVDVKLEYGRGK